MIKSALIVDDSRLACRVMANMLEPLNIRSFSVYSAEEAIDYLQNNKPDIIFLDHTMPGMDGLETIKVIKNNPLTATIPVMMYTAKHGEVYVSQARALGAVDVLPKGLEKELLINALEKLGMVNGEKEQLAKTENPAKPKPIVNEELPATEPGLKSEKRPSWQIFWRQRLEPYLKKQRVKQSEELYQLTRQQTRLIHREIHQTLENFEHALAHRMESHNDFVASLDQLAGQKKRGWLIGVVGVIFAVQAILFWQLSSINETNQALVAAQAKIVERQEQSNDLFNQLNLKLAALNMNQDAAEEGVPSLVLVDFDGRYIADVYPMNLDKGEFQGVTETGYQFVVNSKSQVGEPLSERFYLTENCLGDKFVNYTSSQILRDVDGSLWYIDKHSQPSQININSKMTSQGDCVSMNDEVMELSLLKQNVAVETAIDDQKPLKLVFR
ncbi:response regulator [Aliikangiella marina]|uniref:Response regulator n=1 Tax=Aliikangiella marina TaxID=1712262 RepID=A0A545TIA0_9GAMM|nr:response regulator [Aliikangiella marina]TQV76945.1 response regulator [Aliikangiella marina]